MHYCSKLFQKIGLIEIGPFCLFLCSLNRTVAVLQEVKKKFVEIDLKFLAYVLRFAKTAIKHL